LKNATKTKIRCYLIESFIISGLKDKLFRIN
jgi:hypothetical protein